LTDAAPIAFVREDWTLFRSLSTLCQKAGIPSGRLRRLVAAEAERLRARVDEDLGRNPHHPWTVPVDTVAEAVVDDWDAGGGDDRLPSPADEPAAEPGAEDLPS